MERGLYRGIRRRDISIPKRDTAERLAAVNAIFAAGRFIVETDTGVVKIGDGVTPYASLSSIDVGGKIIAESTFSATTGNYTTLADVTEMGSVTVPDLAYPVALQFFASAFYNDTAGSCAIVSIAKSDNTPIGFDRILMPNWTTPPTGVNASRAANVWAWLPAHSAGTCKLRLQRVTAGNALIFAGTDAKARLTVIGR